MKHRFDWCEAFTRIDYQGTAYAIAVIECPNTHTDYALHFCPTFCPCCGGKLTESAIEGYLKAWKRDIR